MRILSLNQKEDWNQFLIKNGGSFLQSWEWGEFQKNLSKKIWRIRILKGNEILGQAQIIRETFPFKNCLYIPYGPCFKDNLFLKGRKKILDSILKESRKIAKKEKSFFLKIEPTSSWPKDFKKVKSLKRIQPKRTLVLELKKSENDIFKNFHQKIRYNIRLAQRKGVRLIKIDKIKDKMEQKYFDSFYKLIQKTTKRKKYSPYPKEYYRKMLNLIDSRLFLAELKGKIIAANILVFFGRRATYLHGALNYKYRKFMAPHFLQWMQIKEAKERGFEEYDFWGIDEKKWPGLTRFKKSFGGEESEYPEGKDFIFQNLWYRVYKFIKEF